LRPTLALAEADPEHDGAARGEVERLAAIV
jgi:hypothetical protein